MPALNKKIINDPVHGFITVSSEMVMEVINHPWMQRLRRIKQLGLTELVYPGALHTRFHHALGAMHLMVLAMSTLCDKGQDISATECDAATLAILLHDVGHGPYSHALEKSLLHDTAHEEVSRIVIGKLAAELGGPLRTALPMFDGVYPRPFFNQLTTSQLDCDRLDYLKRDCFFTGVLEGAIGATRLIKMLDVDKASGNIVVEEKGIYSVENFLNSRRVMYWQVYLHKTTVCAEEMLIRLIRRARELVQGGERLYAPEWLGHFLRKRISTQDFAAGGDALECYLKLDDADVATSVKHWAAHPDVILSRLATALLDRRLFAVRLLPAPPAEEWIDKARAAICKTFGLCDADAAYFLIQGEVANAAYDTDAPPILIRLRSGQVLPITEASDLPHIAAMAQTVRKHYVCLPKEVLALVGWE